MNPIPNNRNASAHGPSLDNSDMSQTKGTPFLNLMSDRSIYIKFILAILSKAGLISYKVDLWFFIRLIFVRANVNQTFKICGFVHNILKKQSLISHAK